jgi:hypothetical protein
VAILISSLFDGLFLLPFIDNTIMTGLLVMVCTMWVLCLGVLWLFLARYAGVIISLRELYADVQAVLWLQSFNAFESALVVHRRRWPWQLWHRFRSFISMRLIHLSPDERLTLLKQPKSLLLPRHRCYLLIGLLLIAMQSNPFGEGIDNNWMRWPFLLAWALLCLAYLLNLSRSMLRLGFFPRRPWPAVGLALGLSAVLMMPMFRIPGLYGNLVLRGGKADSFWLGVADSSKTIAVQWGHLAFVGLPIMALLGLSFGISQTRRTLYSLNPVLARQLVAQTYRTMSFVSLVAVLAETTLVGIEEYGSSQVTFLDRWQNLLGGNKLIPPVVALGILAAGLSITWLRSRMKPSRNTG